MRQHTRLLSLVAVGAAGAAVAAIPSLATGDTPPSTASFTASDNHWSASGSTTPTIAPGGMVTFSYPSGASLHNAHFIGAQPSSCEQMPATPQPPGWSGTCTFADSGTYHFLCDFHASMAGTIIVGDGGMTTPPTTTTTPPTTTTTTTTGATPKPPKTPAPTTTSKTTTTTTTEGTPQGTSGGSSPASGSAPTVLRAGRTSIRVARSQRGTRVRGSLVLGAGRSRLQVDLLAPRSAIVGGRRGQVRVGRLVRARLGPGRVSFSVPVDTRARRVLRRRHRLALRVAVVATDAAGNRVGRTVPITLRAR